MLLKVAPALTLLVTLASHVYGNGVDSSENPSASAGGANAVKLFFTPAWVPEYSVKWTVHPDGIWYDEPKQSIIRVGHSPLTGKMYRTTEYYFDGVAFTLFYGEAGKIEAVRVDDPIMSHLQKAIVDGVSVPVVPGINDVFNNDRAAPFFSSSLLPLNLRATDMLSFGLLSLALASQTLALPSTTAPTAFVTTYNVTFGSIGYCPINGPKDPYRSVGMRNGNLLVHISSNPDTAPTFSDAAVEGTTAAPTAPFNGKAWTLKVAAPDVPLVPTKWDDCCTASSYHEIIFPIDGTAATTNTYEGGGHAGASMLQHCYADRKTKSGDSCQKTLGFKSKADTINACDISQSFWEAPIVQAKA
ncbi:uncharacterized protein L969DRAFT_65250 [Mixia osmundae IAM 14324]|uniref:Uncharacterized protein n=1 Tax=Mixia osmundae (strain CBS 9802 / IAM 14324 / JCM 22182 / KY 12970) TaxID=764103 RepID=G7DS25_MIXOS|nr:uncharacterized protein L969DRAFT_65250 [Mixia osmundae IAM 14324]KEI37561.1 hypothetical protein L969DRAFT_65250 [Mixia osmundae IAM 14324]GAA93385.1 hypothetical protein E5Q_00025 [Mixia osmundae IAM 14324]